MTEAMPIASPPLGYQLQKEGSVGQALPGVTVEILSLDNDGVLTPGVVGEICVSGVTVLPHYEDDAHGGEGVFTGRGGFRTGDLGTHAEGVELRPIYAPPTHLKGHSQARGPLLV